MRITVQLQPHQFDFAQRWLQLKLFAYAASHLLAHVKPLCNAVCPRYTTLKLDTRVHALHCDLPVFPHTNGVSKLRAQSRLHITFSPRPSIT